MSVTPHATYQAVDSSGNGTFPTNYAVKMRGVILHRPQDMLNTTPGADAFMGGYWQEYIQATDAGDFGGTALWMGQYAGKIMGHPADIYDDAQWLAELNRLNHDPATGHAFKPGDLVEVRARAPGMFNRGKTNINEQHTADPGADFDVVLLQANYGLPTPQVLQLSDVKDSSDNFIFDQTRSTGDEHYQATAVQFNGVSFTNTAGWGPGGSLTIQDGTGRTFPVLLGLGEGFTLYPPPTGSFDIVGIFDQEDKNGADGYKADYRLWVMDYDETGFVLVSNWNQMDYTSHKDYQAVDASGNGTFATDHAIKMRGVMLNWSQTMLDPTASPDAIGGQWQVFFASDEASDQGGTAMWMGQNIGRIHGGHPETSYTKEEWLAEVNRLSHDPLTGHLFRPGDTIEIRARAPGLFNRGKTNINEQHVDLPEANFDIFLIQAGTEYPTPTAMALADVKDVSDQFIFDQTRAAGAEYYQGTLVTIHNVQWSGGTWGPGQQMTVTDGAGHTLPVLLGRGSGFTLYPAPTGSFDVVGIFDQEDTNGADGYKAGYRLWAMDYDGNQFVLLRHVKPDSDLDGDVDATDLAYFEGCALGPAVPQTDPNCMKADFNGDGSVDQIDFGVYQRCYSGAEKLAELSCDQ